MTHMLITVLAASDDDSIAVCEYIMDGMSIGVERVPALAFATMTGDWRDPGDLVGMSFVREID